MILSEFFPRQPGQRLFDIELIDETEDQLLFRLTPLKTDGARGEPCVVAMDRPEISFDPSGRPIWRLRWLPRGPDG